MKNKIELEGIICKDVHLADNRTDFLLCVDSIGESPAYIPCYLENSECNLKKYDKVNISGCIANRAVKGKIVLEVLVKDFSIVERVEG